MAPKSGHHWNPKAVAKTSADLYVRNYTAVMDLFKCAGVSALGFLIGYFLVLQAATGLVAPMLRAPRAFCVRNLGT